MLRELRPEAFADPRFGAIEKGVRVRLHEHARAEQRDDGAPRDHRWLSSRGRPMLRGKRSSRKKCN